MVGGRNTAFFVMGAFVTDLLNLCITFFKNTDNILVMVPLGLLSVSGAFAIFVKMFHKG